MDHSPSHWNKPPKDNATRAMWAFTIYTIMWELTVYGAFAAVIIWTDASAWFFLLAMLISANQWKPSRFREFYGVKEPE